MTAAPLTHHDILALVAPFARSGRQVDLAACDRVQRRVVFKPQQRTLEAPELAGLVEQLALEKTGATLYHLTRTLMLPGGLQAQLDASGSEPGKLLQQVDAVDVQRHFETSAGCTVARHYALPAGALAPLLTCAVVQVSGVTLTMTVSAVRSVSADLVLAPPPGQQLDIPQDLLAVLGWAWSPLMLKPVGWAGKFRLRGTSAQRTQRAEQAMARAGAHLAQTLAAPPADFHRQHQAARWRVVFRRAIPLLTPVLMLISLLVAPRFPLDDMPNTWPLLYQLPTVLIALSFMTQDLPRFEIPPWPRRASAASWLSTPA